MSSIVDNIKKLQSEIKDTQIKYNNNNIITVVAVSKMVDYSKIELAIKAGINHFGENYVQEAIQKWEAIKKQYPKIKLHLIGRLQSNKVKQALKLFDVIETIDSKKIIDKIVLNSKNIDISNNIFYIQVNLSDNNQRNGVPIDNVVEVLDYAKKQGLIISGLMSIAPLNCNNIEDLFSNLKELQIKNNLKVLSLGMSSDYKIAIKIGTTQIRIGTKIFGII